ncbi:Probable RNA-directed DNA polymerase from transposon BS [Eumeta japonica]|uniref:Probable RNA-directed DNA polymerase from transposon BS n=1 Tax=Eumeta variegata TaxID=151549 RepID=A0A4C1T895_EUMVA|nr:Probable RNA-directed DNA polymerase from transposon BS [Eumeta japonica]
MEPPDGGRPIPIRKITNWKRVSTALEEIDTPNLNSILNDIASTHEIDFPIGALTNDIRTMVEESEREVPASSDRRKFPPDILELIRAKNAVFAPRERISHSRVQIQSTSEVKVRVREFRNESWSDLMEEIKPSHKAFWAVTKALKTEGYTPIPPLKKPDNSVAIDDTEIAECLADSIETQCSHASPLHDIAHISRIEEEVLQKTSLEPKDDLAPVSLSEVQTLVKSLNTRKAPGLDGISNKAIKCFSIPLLSLLVAIFNACLKNCYFPPAWKEAEVIGIHKPGKPRDLPASYRPISLLSGLDKIFEKILKTRLSDHLLGKGLIIDEQFGFCPAHSCPQQVLRLVEYVSEGFETERSTVAVFFDVAKAFDRVWHAGLIYKLYSLQVLDRLIITIQNYLANRHFTFRHERTHSTRRLIRAGVPQGSTLSPLLYSAYTNDIPRPSSSGVQLALFADDTALFYGSRNRSTRFTLLPLQRAIDELGQWFRKWRIEVNPDKSAAIQFKYGKIRSRLIVDKNTPNLKMLDANIPWQRNYKYLESRSIKIYTSEIISSVLEILHFSTKQGSGPCSVEKVNYLDVINVPYTKCALGWDLELPTISKYMRDASKRFFDIAESHPKVLLRATVDYQPPHPTHLIRRPRNVLTGPPDSLTAAIESLNDVNDTHD